MTVEAVCNQNHRKTGGNTGTGEEAEKVRVAKRGVFGS
jgi:hypothetical protein